MNKIRIDYIDEIRGLAILLVVMGHIIQFNGISTNNPVFEFIYSFHMPLFFAISGYITQKVTHINNINQYILFIKKKCRSLIVPLLTWSLLINPYFLAEEWEIQTWDNVLKVIESPGLWFLKMLFFILILYGLFNWLGNKISLKQVQFILPIIPVIILSALLIYLKVQDINFLMFSYAFYLGVILSQYTILEKVCLNTITYSIVAIAFLVLATHWEFAGDNIDDLYKILISTFAFLFFFNLLKKINLPINIKQLLQLFGKYSLAIYILQFYLCKFSTLNNFTDNFNIQPFILFLITAIIAIPICYICVLIAKIIETNKICSFFMLGKEIAHKA